MNVVYKRSWRGKSRPASIEDWGWGIFNRNSEEISSGIDNWDDSEIFKEIIRQRIIVSSDLKGTFSDIWPVLFDGFVGTYDSFQYLLDRTLMRPRDLLSFNCRAIEVAVNRGHEKVTKEDIVQAENSYSEDMLLSLGFELRDVNPNYADVLYEFIGCTSNLSKKEVFQLLERGGLFENEAEVLIDLLVWFGFLGVQRIDNDEVHFSHQVRYNLPKLMAPINAGTGRYAIHPAFWKALNCAV